jgi:hypothetical protein
LERIIENDNEVIVTREPILQSPNGEVLKPDVVIQNKERVFVVNVMVRHEEEDNLQEGRMSMSWFSQQWL